MQRPLVCLIAWISLLPVLTAEDVVTLDGRTFRGATAQRLDDDRLMLHHSGGPTPLYFFEVPEPLRRRLGFDTEAALKRLTLENSRLRGTSLLPSAKGYLGRGAAHLRNVPSRTVLHPDVEPCSLLPT